MNLYMVNAELKDSTTTVSMAVFASTSNQAKAEALKRHRGVINVSARKRKLGKYQSIRWGRLNGATKSDYHVIDHRNIQVAKCWFNYCGNPSYVFHFDNDDMLYLIDDYGAMNRLQHSRIVVDRKKDMFKKWG